MKILADDTQKSVTTPIEPSGNSLLFYAFVKILCHRVPFLLSQNLSEMENILYLRPPRLPLTFSPRLCHRDLAGYLTVSH